ncbi:exo-alpha-sialidase [Planctomycetales bacterium ZRK34]|nr:exo-alpha-sialidase [Planctomycetales bacterium ZRK34]
MIPMTVLRRILLAACVAAVWSTTYAQTPNDSAVPGTVIGHMPAAGGMYVGSPSITILPDGAYVASHDLFGPKTKEHEAATTRVFRSEDRGRTWRQVAEVKPAFWSKLFVHRGKLYLMGPTAHHGDLVIRRSDDGGATWTQPTDAKHGLLAEGQYHTAPMPMLIHNGRIWRAIEDATNGRKWGARYSPMVFSAPVDADLLDAASWTHTNFIKIDPTWLGGKFNAWLEGNAVVTPDGHIVDILRMHSGRDGGRAAVVRISDDGKVASFDPEKDLIDFPGGAKKFTIRYDEQTKAYWSLVNPVLPRHQHDAAAAGVRNALALMKSTDLKNWEMRCIVMYHPNVSHHGFQYPDWAFDGDDIIAAIRTGYDDGLGGAHNAHDANFLTFRRLSDFRALKMADSVIAPDQVGLPASK